MHVCMYISIIQVSVCKPNLVMLYSNFYNYVTDTHLAVQSQNVFLFLISIDLEARIVCGSLIEDFTGFN